MPPSDTHLIKQPYQKNVAHAQAGIPEHLLPEGAKQRVASPEPLVIHTLGEKDGKKVSATVFAGLGGVLMMVETRSSVSTCWVNAPAAGGKNMQLSLDDFNVSAEGEGKKITAVEVRSLGGVLMIVETESSVSTCWVNAPA